MFKLFNWFPAFAVLILMLAACGSSNSTNTESSDLVTAQPDTTTSVEDVEDPPVSSEDVTTSSVKPSPAVGDEAASTLLINTECRNGGTVEAFGVLWRNAKLLPAEWLTSAPELDGVLRFESWEVAIFEAKGQEATMTYSIETGEECVLW